jgi:hypothetical protein
MHFGLLVLTHLHAGIEAVNDNAQAHRSLGCSTGTSFVIAEAYRMLDMVFEVIDQFTEHPKILFVAQDLGGAVEVRGCVIPGGDVVALGIPTRLDVAVRPLNNDEHFVFAEFVEFVIRSSEVGDETDLIVTVL